MKKLFFMMALAICAIGMNAQSTKVITGAVIDKGGNPLPNALVEATGGAESVTTEADGTFSIEVPVWLKALTAKYAGLKDKKINLNGRNQVVFEMKPKGGCWFIDAVGTATFGEEVQFGYAGLMGGYLDDWGGYAKVMVPFGGDVSDNIPAVTVGAVKKVAAPVYLYFGLGYAWVIGEYYYSGYKWCYGDSGMMFDGGAIFKINKINVGIGYSFGLGVEYYNFHNHSIQLSVGYCFQ